MLKKVQKRDEMFLRHGLRGTMGIEREESEVINLDHAAYHMVMWLRNYTMARHAGDTVDYLDRYVDDMKLESPYKQESIADEPVAVNNG